jgi:hypothetical protein
MENVREIGRDAQDVVWLGERTSDGELIKCQRLYMAYFHRQT